MSNFVKILLGVSVVGTLVSTIITNKELHKMNMKLNKISEDIVYIRVVK